MIALALATLLSTTIVDDLYGRRLLFADDGRPLVPLGMMQGQTKVVVRAPRGLLLDVGGKPLRVRGKAPVAIAVEGGKPGVVRRLYVVETLEGEARATKRAAADRWRARGLDVVVLDTGAVYGVKGTVVDNRAALIASTAPVPPAMTDVRPVPLDWLDERPTATFVVTAGRRTLRGGFVRVRADGGGAVVVDNVEHSVGYAAHGFEDRRLRDEVVIVPDKNGRAAVVNIVDENDMVAGVLPSEMFPSAPMEALKAQAVTARGELFAKIGRRHFTDPFLVCTEQHCQVYKGLTAEHPRTNEAAKATTGELAFLDGHVVDSVYSACCGGHSEPVDVVWDRPPRAELVGRPDALRVNERGVAWLNPGLAEAFFAPSPMPSSVTPAAAAPPPASHEQRVAERLVSDDDVRAFIALPREVAWCGRSTMNQKGDAWRWTRRFTRAELDAAFADLDVGTVQRIVVEERGPGGRLRALRVEGTSQTARVLRELPVRKRLKNLRSGLFVVDEERDADGALVAVVLRGAGFGHGAGMCQQGAIGMAEVGAGYRDILRHYYAGAEVKQVF
ncbi:MAG: SpoIID/LytB domain-containing protein [Deltaproteobacteria bacterium]|nr:SpoIID/LytB domain-containing protein [Deltaproteobacteria bacterium]